jgi:hypothetical protein
LELECLQEQLLPELLHQFHWFLKLCQLDVTGLEFVLIVVVLGNLWLHLAIVRIGKQPLKLQL